MTVHELVVTLLKDPAVLDKEVVVGFTEDGTSVTAAIGIVEFAAADGEVVLWEDGE